jgi:phosphonate transport system ATP-binding protein
VNLSGGQQQRVAVARLLVQRPDLILADEPFAAVDPVTTERVFEALLDLNREGATLLVNLHDVELARRFPRVVALREGRIAFDGSPEQLSEEALHQIYAGDSRQQGARAEPADTRPGDPIPLAEGRDGISAH